MFLNFSDALTRKKLQDRFQFLAQRFYKFKAAKPKKGTKDVGVEFKCVQCQTGVTITKFPITITITSKMSGFFERKITLNDRQND